VADLFADLRAHIETLGDPVVDLETHVPTEGEINNLCYLSFKYLVGWGMRMADYTVLRMMTPEIKSVKELEEELVPRLADYMWDHICGEPEEPTTETLEEGCKLMLRMIYTMNEADRNCTVAK